MVADQDAWVLHEVVAGLKAAFTLANAGQLDAAIREEATRSGRPMVFAEMTIEDAIAWRRWLDGFGRRAA